MPVCCHSFWCLPCHHLCLVEETLRRVHISRFAQHRIDQIAISVDGSVQIAPPAVHFALRFVDVPRAASLAFTLGTELISQEWCKTCFPLANSFMREHESTLQKHLSQITQVQLVAQSPQDDLKDDVSGKGEVVEGRTRAFMEPALTGEAGEGSIAKLRAGTAHSRVVVDVQWGQGISYSSCR